MARGPELSANPDELHPDFTDFITQCEKHIDGSITPGLNNRLTIDRYPESAYWYDMVRGTNELVSMLLTHRYYQAGWTHACIIVKKRTQSEDSYPVLQITVSLRYRSRMTKLGIWWANRKRTKFYGRSGLDDTLGIQ